MSEFDDEIQRLIDHWDDPTKRNNACYRNNKELTLYFINLGFKEFEARQRRSARTYFKKEMIKPGFMSETYVPLKPLVKAKVSEKTISQALSHATDMFVGWKIGKLEIGMATKEKLLAEALHERKAGAGHIVNALIYERLATPMNDTQTVADHWKTREAIKLIRDEVISTVRDRTLGRIDDRLSP